LTLVASSRIKSQAEQPTFIDHDKYISHSEYGYTTASKWGIKHSHNAVSAMP